MDTNLTNNTETPEASSAIKSSTMAAIITGLILAAAATAYFLSRFLDSPKHLLNRCRESIERIQNSLDFV